MGENNDMKHTLNAVLLFALIALLVCFEIDIQTQAQEARDRIEYETKKKEMELEEIRAELRVIKTDIQILENGWEYPE